MSRLIAVCLGALIFCVDVMASSSYVDVGGKLRNSRYLGVIQIDSGMSQGAVGYGCSYRYRFRWLKMLGEGGLSEFESNVRLLVGAEYFLSAGWQGNPSNSDSNNESSSLSQCEGSNDQSVVFGKHDLFEISWLLKSDHVGKEGDSPYKRYWVSFGEAVYLYPSSFDVQRGSEFFTLVKIDPNVPANSLFDFVPLGDVLEFIKKHKISNGAAKKKESLKKQP